MDHRGRYVWYELMTTDAAAAQAFYRDVVGWGTAPFEGDHRPYTMWTMGEARVGGVFEVPGVPPQWYGYVAVPDVDAAAERAVALGGRVVHGPQDIPTVGRFAYLEDPQGATIVVFRGNAEPMAADPDAEVGEVSWRELATTDHAAAFDFYADLFGWEKQQAMEMGEAGVYQMYGRGERMLGGMYEKSAEQPGPPAWLYYFRVADLDGAVEKVRANGGTIVVEPMEVPGGSRIAVAVDPQGAAFGLHQRG